MTWRIVAALAVWLHTAVALAQDPGRLPLVTVLQIKTTADIHQTVQTMLRDELKALGHIDRKTFRLEFRLTEGDPARLFRGDDIAGAGQAKRDCCQRGSGNLRGAGSDANHPYRRERQ
jgi:hypothetical protein